MSIERERMENAYKQNEIIKADNAKLLDALKLLKNIQSNTEALTKYYFNQWADDLIALEDEGFTNDVMNEDTLFETIQDQYEIVKKILLECAIYINRDEVEGVEYENWFL